MCVVNSFPIHSIKITDVSQNNHPVYHELEDIRNIITNVTLVQISKIKWKFKCKFCGQKKVKIRLCSIEKICFT